VNTTDRYQRAAKRVKQIRDFYIHATVYLFVNAALLLIDLITSPDSTWFYWPLLFWGIGLAAHALVVFGPARALGENWEERKIRELMERDGTA
jgi:hypothetical protein